jgi:serine protease Do
METEMTALNLDRRAERLHGPTIAVAARRVSWQSMRLILVLMAAAILFGVTGAQARPAPESFADLAAKLLPAVVNISTSQTVKKGSTPQMPQLPPGSPFEEFFKEFFDRQQRREKNGQPQRKATSLGSGFIIDTAGLVVTNNHVIDGAEEIYVILHDNTRLKAKVVGRDAKTDLAVLKVETDIKLTSVRFGDSDKSRIGDWVVAIGNPFGLGGTVTAGIISARARNINSGPYDDFIQTDASINRGNSGGPLFNLAGEVIGINTAIYSPTGGSVGIGFSIPSKLAEPLINQLKEFGRARRGWLGVRIQTVTEELAESLGMGKPRGALVASLTEGGPARTSDIEVGDVILSFDGKPIKEMRNLPRIVAETIVGKKVKVVVWRKGREESASIVLGEFPEDDKIALLGKDKKKNGAKIEKTAVLGLTLSLLTDELRAQFQLEKSVEGVVVTEVAGDSSAAAKQVRPGSVIRKIGSDQEVVKTPHQVQARVETARKAKHKSLLLLFERGGDSRFVALPLNPKKVEKTDAMPHEEKKQ